VTLFQASPSCKFHAQMARTEPNLGCNVTAKKNVGSYTAITIPFKWTKNTQLHKNLQFLKRTTEKEYKKEFLYIITSPGSLAKCMMIPAAITSSSQQTRNGLAATGLHFFFLASAGSSGGVGGFSGLTMAAMSFSICEGGVVGP
jgi:hypothetical protein